MLTLIYMLIVSWDCSKILTYDKLLFFTTTLGGRYYPHFSEKRIEAQRGSVRLVLGHQLPNEGITQNLNPGSVDTESTLSLTKLDWRGNQ